jgi:malate dehydrogenase (oxaloacetate-decarboxylating)(NADP+)
MARRGVTPDLAKAIMRTNTTAIGAVMVHRDEADSLICGTFGEYLLAPELRHAGAGHGRRAAPGGALSPDDPGGRAAVHRRHPCASRTHAEQIAETVIGAARHVRRFGIEPKIALCSQSQFGNLDSEQPAADARRARDPRRAPRDFATRARCTSTAALDPELRERIFPGNRMKGRPMC